ncbi:PA4642 family protein [Alcanivorax quisquiliarum]|uniref:PA4642 family protein n=1 Tax=Alcanivorax quisquiliarum TaxID=2933565 RepID=A0ABT0E8M6_9GAMM|nr:PA4642 family protein [Alcanivorax quisquiliarum]MCK0538190.1 PA4642 family protein [Alcanivorax quisquiliarum]
MSERKDKKKVIGEPMTDDQIRIFLDTQPEAGVDTDFHVLLRAYRSLREEDFERFIGFFVANGGNLQARDPAGRTLADIISRHTQATAYLHALGHQSS